MECYPTKRENKGNMIKKQGGGEERETERELDETEGNFQRENAEQRERKEFQFPHYYFGMFIYFLSLSVTLRVIPIILLFFIPF